jgi:hypothetical protein
VSAASTVMMQLGNEAGDMGAPPARVTNRRLAPATIVRPALLMTRRQGRVLRG